MRQQTLSIGDVRVRLRSAHEDFWARADRCYQGFFAADGSPPEETIEITLLPEADLSLPEGGPQAGAFSERNGTLRLVHGRGIAEWDKDRQLVRVRQAEADFEHGPTHPEYVCDTVLRAILARRLASAGGCLVHAASMVRNGRGYLLVGASGAGKSTVARVSAATCTVLSDDVSLVRLSSHGERLFATPFVGEYESSRTDRNAPLTAICFLRQAVANALRPVSRQPAVRELLRAVLLPGHGRAANQALLELVVTLADRVPCYDLHFSPDPSFWRCLDERHGAGSE